MNWCEFKKDGAVIVLVLAFWVGSIWLVGAIESGLVW